MKLVKSLIFILLVCLSPAVQANSVAQLAQNLPMEDHNLKRFNQSARIQYIGRDIISDNSGNPLLSMKYTIENTGDKTIKSIHWMSAYISNQQIIFVQDIPLTFSNPLLAKHQMDISVNIPLDIIPQPSQAIFIDVRADIQTLNGAKNIAFNDGEIIEVN